MPFFKRALLLRYSNDAYNYYGCCLLQLDRLDEASAVFSKLIRRNPYWERPIINLGRVYIKKGDFHSSLFMLNRALSMNPNNEDIYFYRGVLFDKIKDNKKAIKAYEASLKINYDQPESHYNLGISYAKERFLLDAILKFSYCVNHQYRIFDSLFYLGVINRVMKRYQTALGNFIKAYELEPLDPGINCELAEIYFLIEDFDKSKQYFNELVQLSQGNIDKYSKRKIFKKIVSFLAEKPVC